MADQVIFLADWVLPHEEIFHIVIAIHIVQEFFYFRLIQVVLQPFTEFFFWFPSDTISEFDSGYGIFAITAKDGKRERQVINRNIAVVGEFHHVSRTCSGQEIRITFQGNGNVWYTVSWCRINGIFYADGIFYRIKHFKRIGFIEWIGYIKLCGEFGKRTAADIFCPIGYIVFVKCHADGIVEAVS